MSKPMSGHLNTIDDQVKAALMLGDRIMFFFIYQYFTTWASGLSCICLETRLVTSPLKAEAG